MASNPSIRQRLLTEINQLPESQLSKVLQFVGALQSNRQRSAPKTDASQDPLTSFIGAASHGSLAQDVDAELYGD